MTSPTLDRKVIIWARQKIQGHIKPWHMLYPASPLRTVCKMTYIKVGRSEFTKQMPEGKVCQICKAHLV
jgi:hypothetical protein